jgi:eukaryotic-like serine/threonine-protein kinase
MDRAPERPQLDPIVTAVIRERARAELFGCSEPVRVGRYELRRHVGTGGGGSVFVAWDAELAREVALKLVSAPEPALRRRALAEGRALAQLSHSNVVPVFDVGEIEDRVYLVMELVRGTSLREYGRTARPRAIMEAYRQCALGLAAAHAARLVHRDFKPDNAVIADDGRVRVIDFGLAVESGNEVDRAGTPAYMAPEQVRGELLTAAADQYALGVSLREALGKTGRAIDRVTARAMAESPRDRFPSMAELERALALLDPATRWRRRVYVIAPLAIAATAFGIGSMRERDEPCSRDGLEEVWSPMRHEVLAARFRALGEYGAIAAARLDRLDEYASDWRDSQRTACVAHADGELSATAYDHRQACLASARTQLTAIAELADGVRADTLANVVRAIPELLDLASCDDPSIVAPPTIGQEWGARTLRARLDRARTAVQAGAGDVTALARLVDEARALGYRPLVADASLVLGTAHLLRWQFEQAKAPLHTAYLEALQVGDYRTAVEAYARYAWIRSRSDPAHPDVAGNQTAVALAEGLPSSARFAQALLHNNLGSIAIAANDVSLARTEFETSLVLARDVEGPGAVELSAALSNLALVTDDPSEQQRLFARRIAILTRSVGADHALTLATRKTAALVLVDETAARRALAAPCDQLARLHPDARAPLVECGLHRGWLALAAGDLAEAKQQLPMAAGPLGSAYLALARGDRGQATTQFRALRAETPEPSSWLDLFDAGQVELGLALAGDPTATGRAKVLLERALALHPRWSPIAWRLAWLQRH